MTQAWLEITFQEIILIYPSTVFETEQLFIDLALQIVHLVWMLYKRNKIKLQNMTVYNDLTHKPIK